MIAFPSLGTVAPSILHTTNEVNQKIKSKPQIHIANCLSKLKSCEEDLLKLDSNDMSISDRAEISRACHSILKKVDEN